MLRRRLHHRQHRRDRQGIREPRAGLGAAEVSDDGHRRDRQALQRAEERADHEGCAGLPRPGGLGAVPDLPRHRRQPSSPAPRRRTRWAPRTSKRSATTGTSSSREWRRPRRGSEGRRHSDRRRLVAGHAVRNMSAQSHAGRGGLAAADPQARSQTLAPSYWMLAPALLGLLVFFVYPLVAIGVLLVHPVRPAVRSGVDRIP